nr:MAG TPA: HNH endonuclease [Caudoviricetes sp.]
MARRNKRRHYQAPRIVILGKTDKKNKPRESASRCAFCGRPLFRESAWHWIYDEFGQRVKKCNNEALCRECRSQEGEDAYITAVTGRRPRHEEEQEE